MEGTQRVARILDELRGGHWSFAEDRRAAEAISSFWPKAGVAVRFYDRFRAAVAEDAVLRGITAVVFGEGGFPFGDPPHLAAARASTVSTFIYAESSPVITALRRRSLAGGGSAAAITASIRDPAGLLAAIGEARGDGAPLQVQWGLAAMVMSRGEAAALAAEYARLLPSGSELVIAVPDGDAGRQFARITGTYPHTARNVSAWCDKAGLKLDGPVTDVRAWGRETLGGALRASGGRIMAAAARVT